MWQALIRLHETDFFIDAESGEASTRSVVVRRQTILSPQDAIMKVRLLLALVGLAISFGLPTFAQQKDAADRRIVQQRDLLGSPSSLGEFGELSQKLDEAYNKNDAAAAAALFTEDALLVAPDGMFSGRQAIEKRYEDTFQRWPIGDFNSRREPSPECDRQRGLVGRTIGEYFSKPDRSRICVALLVSDLCS